MTDLRAEAESLALEREPGDVQFDEESGEGGTVAVDRERDLTLAAQAQATIAQIDVALTAVDDKTYGVCDNCHQADPEGAASGASLRPSLYGVQERGTSPPLSGPAPRRHGATRLAIAGVVACCVVAVDQLTKSWAVSRLCARRHPRLLEARSGAPVQLRKLLQLRSGLGPGDRRRRPLSWSRSCSSWFATRVRTPWRSHSVW